MNLDKARETLQYWLDEQKIFPNSDLAKSLTLAIEALNRIVAWRRGMNLRPDYDLPGETKD